MKSGQRPGKNLNISYTTKLLYYIEKDISSCIQKFKIRYTISLYVTYLVTYVTFFLLNVKNDNDLFWFINDLPDEKKLKENERRCFKQVHKSSHPKLSSVYHNKNSALKPCNKNIIGMVWFLYPCHKTRKTEQLKSERKKGGGSKPWKRQKKSYYHHPLSHYKTIQ